MSAIHLLGRRLAACVDAAHEVMNARELDDSYIGGLIVAAAVLDAAQSPALPDCVTDLLLAAKSVCCDRATCLKHPRLSEAIAKFEDAVIRGGRGDD
ncbi:MAG: hypothetical protein LBU11_06970 [Zoogloeaceae bacterium]|jgi:hypothetical protein|nr:hypothetical protein [Zoogloeaceae bacterium]